jgi:hypothetical protein
VRTRRSQACSCEPLAHLRWLRVIRGCHASNPLSGVAFHRFWRGYFFLVSVVWRSAQKLGFIILSITQLGSYFRRYEMEPTKYRLQFVKCLLVFSQLLGLDTLTRGRNDETFDNLIEITWSPEDTYFWRRATYRVFSHTVKAARFAPCNIRCKVLPCVN